MAGWNSSAQMLLCSSGLYSDPGVSQHELWGLGDSVSHQEALARESQDGCEIQIHGGACIGNVRTGDQ